MSLKTQGSKIYYSIGSPTTFNAIGKITGIDGPGGSTSKIDSTDLDDTQYKEFITGLIDPGDLNLDVNFDPNLTAMSDLKAAQEAGTLLEWKITPTGSAKSCFFTGFVTSMRTTAATDAKWTAKVAVAVSGSIVWA